LISHQIRKFQGGRNVYRFPYLALAVLLLASASLATAQCRTLIITGHPNYPPVGWRYGGHINGAGKDLVAHIARQLGLKAESKDLGTWEEAQAATRDGKADVIVGIYYNPLRATYLDYVQPPFMRDPDVIFVKKGHTFPFRQWRDLKGKKGVTNKGESYGMAFDRYMASQLTVSRAPTVDAAFRQLMDDRADYLIIGLYPGLAKIRELGLADQVTRLPQQLLSEPMYIAFSKRSACRRYEGVFARHLQQVVQMGGVPPLLQDAGRQWIGERLQHAPMQP
jgi:polar amino acid transport system substrate-binding protein